MKQKILRQIYIVMLSVVVTSSAQGVIFYPLCFGACVTGCEAVCAALTGPGAVLCLPECIGGCGTACAVTCFAPTTTLVTLDDGVEVVKVIAEVTPGDLVKTIRDGKPVWTKVTRNVKEVGHFVFLQVESFSETLGSGANLSVTPSHVMIVASEDMTLKLVSAAQLMVGNKLMDANGHVLSVVGVQRLFMDSKFTLETAEGTVLASEVFVATICGDVVAGGEQLFESRMKEWHATHDQLLQGSVLLPQ